MEYEFRGWNGKEFIYGGAPVKNLSGGYHYVRDGYGMVIEHSVVAIDQCTGLTDINGVKIYGGDIIHAFGAPLQVKWIVDGWFADCELTGVCEAGQEWDDNCLVIGNIHQNPELLE